MAFNTPITGAQYWAQYRNRSPNPANMNPPLNPSVPQFQPNGTEMALYQGLSPSPPSSNSPATPANMMQLQRFMVDNHFAHTKDLASLERKTKRNSDEIQNITACVTNDLQTLQSQLQDLKNQMATHQEHNEAVTRGSRAEQDLTPTAAFTENFSKERIAEVYLEEAEDYERAAMKLREQAEELCKGAEDRKLGILRLLNAEDGVSAGTYAEAEFACCGKTFDSIQDMLEHIGESHGLHVGHSESTTMLNGSGESTPTHVPARRSKVEKPDGDYVEEPRWAKDEGASPPKLENTTSTEPASIGAVTKGDKASDSAVAPTSSEIWKPLAVRNMKESKIIVSDMNQETFSWEFLKHNLGGEQWSPGFYFITNDSILPSSAYWILDADYEPYLPTQPGQHGAKITAFFNSTVSEPGEAPDEENYKNTPVFICPEGDGREYVYFGDYSQKRFSDKLDYDRVMTVPKKVRRYWADQLAAEGRPEWVTKCLMEHFWPKPTYLGPMPTDSGLNTPVTEETPRGVDTVLEKRVSNALNEYAFQLKDWEKETRMKVSHLMAENLMLSFENGADADEEPGLRLWWEYLECGKYDQGFYEFLVKLKYQPKLQKASGARVVVPPRGRDQEVGGKVVKPVNGGVESLISTTGCSNTSTSQTTTPRPPKPTPTKAKPHTAGTKPWEQPSKQKTPNGDLDMAKQLQQEHMKTQAGRKGGGGVNNGVKDVGAYVAPHIRAKRWGREGR